MVLKSMQASGFPSYLLTVEGKWLFFLGATIWRTQRNMAFRCCYDFTCKYNNSSLHLEYCGKPTLSGRKTGATRCRLAHNRNRWELGILWFHALSESGVLVFLFVSVLFFVSNPVSVMVTAGGEKQKHCDKKINWLYMELFKYRSFPTWQLLI